MKLHISSGLVSEAVPPRGTALFRAHQLGIFKRIDRLFAALMVVQWLFGIAAALWISPKTWAGQSSHMHLHVWAALFFGAVITSFPVFLALSRPGAASTRHAIAIGQMLMSALLIHLTGGRIETHFHVFGSLAFLSFYRDWRVLVSATVVVAADHFLRGVFWPQSVFGVLVTSPWRWLEHAGWVVFEDIFLFISIRQSMEEMREVANRRADLEAVNTGIEATVVERTAELTREIADRKQVEEALRKSEAQLSTIVENLTEGIAVSGLDGQFLHFNRAALDIHGYASLHECRRHLTELTDTFELSGLDGTPCAVDQWPLARILRGEALRGLELNVRHTGAGWQRVFSYGGSLVHDAAGLPLMAIVTISDITERKRAEACLEKANQELLETSRQAGMAEVATGVLHNVGNVLNSVNVSATIVANRIKDSKSASLGKLVNLLREHDIDLGAFLTQDPKGKQVPLFLAALAENLETERADVLRELSNLHKNIEHIKHVVSMQQGYARVSGITEALRVDELLEDTLRMNASLLNRHDVHVVREFADVPPIQADKHKLLQLLVNLVRNANQACEESGRADKRLTLRVERTTDAVRISVSDNGVGIPPENLTRIFNHGFTTKKDGHGFGLHSGALAAKEMGGILSVHSDGPGRGATFAIEFGIRSDTINLPKRAA